MKSVLISIQPKWVEKIASKEKTIEVRKTRPKIETPFKVYIYCTKAKEVVDIGKTFSWGKEVIGEFVCDSVYEWKYLPDHMDENEYEYYIVAKDGFATCLTYDEIENYGKGETLYGWHISNLKIYDKPKELSEFKRWNRTEENSSCANMKWLYPDCKDCKECNLTRPPQSWCYVEENENER